MYLTLCGCKQNQKKNTILSDVIEFWKTCKLLQKQLDDLLSILIQIFDYGFALNNYYAHNKSLFRFFSVAFQARQRKKQTHKNIKQVNLYLSVSLGWSV